METGTSIPKLTELAEYRYVNVLPTCNRLAILVSEAQTDHVFIQRVMLLKKIVKKWTHGCDILIEWITPADSDSDDDDGVAVDLDGYHALHAAKVLELDRTEKRLNDFVSTVQIKEEVTNDLERSVGNLKEEVDDDDAVASNRARDFQNSSTTDAARKRRKHLTSARPPGSEKERHKIHRTTGKGRSEINSRNARKLNRDADSRVAGTLRSETSSQNVGECKSEIGTAFEAACTPCSDVRLVEKTNSYDERDKLREEGAVGQQRSVREDVEKSGDRREELTEDSSSALRRRNNTEEDVGKLSEEEEQSEDLTWEVAVPRQKRKYKPRRKSAEAENKQALGKRTIEDEADECKSKKLAAKKSKKVGIVYVSDDEDSETASVDHDPGPKSDRKSRAYKPKKRTKDSKRVDVRYESDDKNSETDSTRQYDKTENAKDDNEGYPCRSCEMNFSSYYKMKKHMIKIHGGMDGDRDSSGTGSHIPCKRCEMKFKNYGQMRNHMLETHGGVKDVDIGCPDGQFPCSHCGLKLRSYYQLKRHKQKIHENDDGKSPDEFRFTCGQCGMKIRTYYQYKKHMLKDHGTRFAGGSTENDNYRIIPGMKPFRCEICNKHFASKTFLKRHDLMLHLNPTKKKKSERTYVCIHCGKCMTNCGNYSQHVRRHIGIKPHACDICGKAFLQAGALRIHIRRHTGEKPYVCNICGKRYIISCALKDHIRSHTGEKPFVCTACPKSFTQQFLLTKHFKIVHCGECRYMCSQCSKKFTSSSHLRRHILIAHEKARPYVCSVCHKSFTHSGHLKVHKRIHTGEKPYKCTKCEMTFPHKNVTFKKHLLSHDVDDFDHLPVV